MNTSSVFNITLHLYFLPFCLIKSLTKKYLTPSKILLNYVNFYSIVLTFSLHFLQKLSCFFLFLKTHFHNYIQIYYYVRTKKLRTTSRLITKKTVPFKLMKTSLRISSRHPFTNSFP